MTPDKINEEEEEKSEEETTDALQDSREYKRPNLDEIDEGNPDSIISLRRHKSVSYCVMVE